MSVAVHSMYSPGIVQTNLLVDVRSALFLRDITFVGEANETVTANEEINTEKMDMLGDQIDALLAFQNYPYEYPVEENLRFFLDHLQVQ